MARHTTAKEDMVIENLDCDDSDRVSGIIERLDTEISNRDEHIERLTAEFQAEIDELKTQLAAVKGGVA